MPGQLEKLKRFNPPAYLKDFEEGEQLDEWSNTVDGWFNDEIAGRSSPGRSKLTQFFNPTLWAYDKTLPPVPITWVGFPLNVSVNCNMAYTISNCVVGQDHSAYGRRPMEIR